MAATLTPKIQRTPKVRWGTKILRALGQTYTQVLIGIAAGLVLGLVAPSVAVDMKPLADAFVRLIKMCIGPVVFLAIVHGINSAGSLKTAGRVALKALIYFEIVTTIAMLLGWLVGEIIQPGAGLHLKMADLDSSAIAGFAGPKPVAGSGPGWLQLIPGSLIEPFVRNDVVQLLLLAVLSGIALLGVSTRTPMLGDFINQLMAWVFRIVGLITSLAPLAAFGAIGFTIGKYGLYSLIPLVKLVLAYYIAALLFMSVVLWGVLRSSGVGMRPFLNYFKDEIVIVFGTIASEAVMPRLIAKLEHLGCKSDVVRIVLPTAYSFNLDGTALYLVLAPLFIAQSLDLTLSWSDKLGLFFLLMLTSKGAAGVTGGVLVTLVSTMLAYPLVPAAGLSVTLGVDRFLNEGRAVLNLIGNAAATIFIARWDRSLDHARMAAVLSGELPYD